ncbi:MAG: alpha-galactosidase [Candidatus Aminicenantes bacterium]|nr:alpha-galactosidase [Candidatus Aminicenantes bacterium]
MNKRWILTAALMGAFSVLSVASPAAAPQAADRSKVILTPKPGPEPNINGPKVFGVRPGRPFLYRIPCTGERPISFAVKGLPGGLAVDAASGIITGTAPAAAGRYPMTFAARNDKGSAEREFVLVVGDTLALTPPMGWNDWYIHYEGITEKHMREAAETMIASGMADYGYMYVNIDDCWMKKKGETPYRDGKGVILPNAKFPDIKGMVDFIHGKGLRAGLYTSPGPWTCAGYVGSQGYEELDASTFAAWGFDFLKYDWCSYGDTAAGEDREKAMKPYKLMGDILKKQSRDIVYNLCQYGMSNVWEWGGSVGGNCWRTTGDLGNEASDTLPGFLKIGLSNAGHFAQAKPGQWNDPDYILIGWVGNTGEQRPTPLTGDEQYTYMSMWCLMAAPLIFSGDMSKLDDFTLNILCNNEVIEIDQDALGKQGRIIRKTPDEMVMVKELEDGSRAVGLFNLGVTPKDVSISFRDLGFSGKAGVRDLWRQKNLGNFRDTYAARVNPRGVILVRVTK